MHLISRRLSLVVESWEVEGEAGRKGKRKWMMREGGEEKLAMSHLFNGELVLGCFHWILTSMWPI